MSLYDLNPELAGSSTYGDPATDPVGTVRAYLGAHPSDASPAERVFRKRKENWWTRDSTPTAVTDNWVRDCPVIYRPVTR